MLIVSTFKRITKDTSQHPNFSGRCLLMKTVTIQRSSWGELLSQIKQVKTSRYSDGGIPSLPQPSPKVLNLKTINSRSLFIWLSLRLSRLLQTLERNFLNHVKAVPLPLFMFDFHFLFFFAVPENQGRKFIAWQHWARHFHLGCQKSVVLETRKKQTNLQSVVSRDERQTPTQKWLVLKYILFSVEQLSVLLP